MGVPGSTRVWDRRRATAELATETARKSEGSSMAKGGKEVRFSIQTKVGLNSIGVCWRHVEGLERIAWHREQV